MGYDSSAVATLSSTRSIRQISPRSGYLQIPGWPHTLSAALMLAGAPHAPESGFVISILKSIAEPLKIAEMLAMQFPAMPWSMVHGTIDERIFVFPASSILNADEETGGPFILCSLGRPIGACPFPVRAEGELIVDNPDQHVSTAHLRSSLLNRMTAPRIKLVALYHPEVFPLPRLALSISDLARSLRRQLIGQVSMEDMQLGPSLDDILASIDRERPDIIGISATFGQQDLLHALLEQVMARADHDYRPRVIVGGSLCALNSQFLVQRFPGLVVAKGPGERTICDFVRHHIRRLNSHRWPTYSSSTRPAK
jgi:hypothetical protein